MYENHPIETELTVLQKFYYGTNILITGGTGFLGKGKFNQTPYKQLLLIYINLLSKELSNSK